jgi:hypothetical protein
MQPRKASLRTLGLAAVVLIGVVLQTTPASADPTNITVNSTRPAACTVTKPQDPTLRSSFASAFRCTAKSSTGNGDVVGAAVIWGSTYGPERAQNTWCTGGIGTSIELGWLNSCSDITRASVTIQFTGQYYSEGQERLTAAVAYDIIGGSHCYYYGVQHNGGGTRYSLVDCLESDASYNTVDWTHVAIRPSSTGARYNFCWGKGYSFSCDKQTTNVGLFYGMSAEQFVSNDHTSIPGSSRHRGRFASIESLKSNGSWVTWGGSSETGVSAGGYAGVDSPAGYDRCLRTGNLTPNCY